MHYKKQHPGRDHYVRNTNVVAWIFIFWFRYRRLLCFYLKWPIPLRHHIYPTTCILLLLAGYYLHSVSCFCLSVSKILTRRVPLHQFQMIFRTMVLRRIVSNILRLKEIKWVKQVIHHLMILKLRIKMFVLVITITITIASNLKLDKAFVCIL